MADSLFTRRNLQEQRLNASPERKRSCSCGGWSARADHLRDKPDSTKAPWQWYTIIIFYIVIISFLIFGMFVCPVCVIIRVYVRCGPAYRRILLMRSLINKKEYCTIDLDQVSVGQWRSLLYLPQNSNAPEHTSFSDQHAHGRANAFAIKQCDAGRENDNCVGLKLAKNTGCMIGPFICYLQFRKCEDLLHGHPGAVRSIFSVLQFREYFVCPKQTHWWWAPKVYYVITFKHFLSMR